MIQWVKDHNPPFHMHLLLAVGVLNLVLAMTESSLPWLSGMSAGWCFGSFLALYIDWRHLEAHKRIFNELFADIDKLARYQIQKQKKEFEGRVAEETGRRLREIDDER